MRTLLNSVLFALMSATCAVGDINLTVIRPGVGLFPAGPPSFTRVEEVPDGHRIWFHVEPGGGAPGGFEVSWSGAVWSKLTLSEDSMEADEFSPFGNQGGIPVNNGTTVILPPVTSPAAGNAHFLRFSTLDAGCAPDCPETDYFAEYSVVEIAAPLVGDFNVDNNVDVTDFLILSRNFGEHKFQASKAFLSWMDGDANLDDTIDFADFLLLSDNFGAAREPPAVGVPESASAMLLTLGLLGFRAFRRLIDG